VVVSHKMFWWGCFAPPRVPRPGATVPLCSPLVTPRGHSVNQPTFLPVKTYLYRPVYVASKWMCLARFNRSAIIFRIKRILFIFCIHCLCATVVNFTLSVLVHRNNCSLTISQMITWDFVHIQIIFYCPCIEITSDRTNDWRYAF